jgi:hypothetical protein
MRKDNIAEAKPEVTCERCGVRYVGKNVIHKYTKKLVGASKPHYFCSKCCPQKYIQAEEEVNGNQTEETRM